MGELELEGPGALAFLQRVTSNDVARLVVGQAQYSALPDAERGPGGRRDRLPPRARDRYRLVVNAGNIEKDLEWLGDRHPEGCTLVDRSDAFALLALQGPKAQGILQPLTDVPLARSPSIILPRARWRAPRRLVSRTGYTGEDGFELFVPPENAEALWAALLEGGRDPGAGAGRPRRAGHAASRGADVSLRQRHGRDHDPGRGGPGLDRVARNRPRGSFPDARSSRPRRRTAHRASWWASRWWGGGSPATAIRVLLGGDDESGTVTSGTYAPFLQKNIGLCYLPAARAAVGTSFDVEIRDRRVAARVVPTPFYKRPR